MTPASTIRVEHIDALCGIQLITIILKDGLIPTRTVEELLLQQLLKVVTSRL